MAHFFNYLSMRLTTIIFSLVFVFGLVMPEAAFAAARTPTMISQRSSAAYTVVAATNACRSMNAACTFRINGTACDGTTYTGWRLPTLEELALFDGIVTLYGYSHSIRLNAVAYLYTVPSTGAIATAAPTGFAYFYCVR